MSVRIGLIWLLGWSGPAYIIILPVDSWSVHGSQSIFISSRIFDTRRVCEIIYIVIFSLGVKASPVCHYWPVCPYSWLSWVRLSLSCGHTLARHRDLPNTQWYKWAKGLGKCVCAYVCVYLSNTYWFTQCYADKSQWIAGHIGEMRVCLLFYVQLLRSKHWRINERVVCSLLS